MKNSKKRPPLRATMTMTGVTYDGTQYRVEKEVVFKRSRVKKADEKKRAA